MEPNVALIGLAGILVGAVIAGGFSVYNEWAKQQFEKQVVKRDLLLKKYEDIYRDLTNYATFVAEMAFKIIAAAGHDVKFEAGNFNSTLKDNNVYMNGRFYAREIYTELGLIEQQHKILGQTIAEIITTKDLSRSKKLEYANAAAGAAKEIAALVDQAKEKLSTLVSIQINS